MAKLLVTLSLTLVVASIGTNASKLPKQLNVELVPTDQMEDILKKYPSAVELKREVRVETGDAKARKESELEYWFGKRIEGDFRVAHYEDTQSWDAPQDVESGFDYPVNGREGAIITRVTIKVWQSTFNGKAYIVSGGIGERHIRVVIETYQTFILDHIVNFYGYYN